MENHIEFKESGTQICGHWNAIIDINIYTINGRQQWRNAGECNTSYLIKPWKPKWFNWILFNLLVGAYFHLSFKCHSFVILPDSFDTDIIPSFIAGDQWLCSIMQPLLLDGVCGFLLCTLISYFERLFVVYFVFFSFRLFVVMSIRIPINSQIQYTTLHIKLSVCTWISIQTDWKKKTNFFLFCKLCSNLDEVWYICCIYTFRNCGCLVCMKIDDNDDDVQYQTHTFTANEKQNKPNWNEMI